MNIVENVAEAVAEIPGDPSSLEIARVAIEAYQTALWPPFFDPKDRYTILPEPRRQHANMLTAHIMQVVGKYLCRHDDVDGAREASRELFEALFESGAYVVTDADRAAAGVPMREGRGLTREEMKIMELKRMQAMLEPMPPMILSRSPS